MITKAQILSDIELQLLQAAPTDDTQLEWTQMAFWVGYHLNSLVTEEINGKLSRGEQIPPIYIKLAECEPLILDAADCGDSSQDKVYIQITDDILTVNGDRGLIKVITDEGDEVRKISVETINMFKNLRFSKPSDSNLTYYRQARKIFIQGFDPQEIPFNQINVYYVPKQDILAAGLTDEVLVSDLILPVLINAVVERGKLELYGTQVDTSNDGIDNKVPVYHTAIANPNQQPQ